MEYKHFADLDYYDKMDEAETMGDRFNFYKSSQLYSYNQAVWMMLVHIRDFESDEFDVRAYDAEVGRVQTLYKGNKCFDWYMNLEADSLRRFKTIEFHNKENDAFYKLEMLRLDGKCRYIVFTG